MVLMPISSGVIQFRFAEGLNLLSLIFFETIPAMTVGCLLVNILTGCATLDIIVGTLITFISSLLTYLVGKTVKKVWLKTFLGGLPHVLLNAFILPLIWCFYYGDTQYIYLISCLFVLLGQVVSVYLLGYILYKKIIYFKQKNIDFFV